MTNTQIMALCQRFRARATAFMREANESASPRNTVRLTAMASTRQWAARELCFCADIKPTDGDLPVKEGEA